MDDKTLAEKVVALGVCLEQSMFTDDYTYHGIGVTADKAVRDWRVAGALMDMVREREWLVNTMHDGYVYVFTDMDNGGEENDGTFCSETTEWPRAIVEACVEALNG